MIAGKKLRERIKEQIESIPEEKLDDLLDYIRKLTHQSKSSKIMNYAGLWEDMDKETLNSLTVDLPEIRLKESLE